MIYSFIALRKEYMRSPEYRSFFSYGNSLKKVKLKCLTKNFEMNSLFRWERKLIVIKSVDHDILIYFFVKRIHFLPTKMMANNKFITIAN